MTMNGHVYKLFKNIFFNNVQTGDKGEINTT